MKIRRGHRGNWRECYIRPEGPNLLRMSREDSQLGFYETLMGGPGETIQLALQILGEQPVLKLMENERMLSLARMVLSAAKAAEEDE